MMLISGFFAAIVVVIASVQPARCESTLLDLKQVCNELQNPANVLEQFNGELGMKDKYGNELKMLIKRGDHLENIKRIRGFIANLEHQLSDKKSKQKLRNEIQSALTYAYYHLALSYSQADQMIAALANVDHLKSLRMKYKGIPVTQVLQLDNVTRISLKYSCGGNLNRLLGSKSRDDKERVDELYKELKESFEVTGLSEFSSIENDMQLVRKLTDIAYELKSKSLNGEKVLTE